MGYLLPDRLRVFRSWGNSYLPASCLAYVQLDIPEEKTSGCQASQGECERRFVCVQALLWLPERHIKVNRGTQKPLASRACDNRGIKSGSLDTVTVHAHKGSHKLDVAFPANLLLVLQVLLSFVVVF